MDELYWTGPKKPTLLDSMMGYRRHSVKLWRRGKEWVVGWRGGGIEQFFDTKEEAMKELKRRGYKRGTR